MIESTPTAKKVELIKDEVKTNHFKSRKKQQKIGKIITYILLIGVSIVLLAPLWWMISTSLKSMQEVVQYPPTLFPEEFHWSNYLDTMRSFPFIKYAKNTLFITFFVVLGNILSNSFIAYGFAKIDFPGKNILFSMVLATMMVPGFVTMIPQYILFTKLRWVGTYLPLIVPSFFGCVFIIFFMLMFYLLFHNVIIVAFIFIGDILFTNI